MSEQGIIPSRQGNSVWWSSGSIPDALSVAKWSLRNKSVPQQTFLGASIRNFNVGGGLSTASSLDVQLVEDEYNVSDKIGLGGGDDPYHDGKADHFIPPTIDAPVFFKFGNIRCTIEEAWRKTYDDVYGYDTIDIKPVVPEFEVNNPGELTKDQYIDFLSGIVSGNKMLALDESSLNTWNGKGIDHFIFGGIIKNHFKSYDENGIATLSCRIEDPRSILEGTKVLLDSWDGNNFDLANYLNVYGFLEHDLNSSVKTAVSAFYNNSFLMSKNVSNTGDVSYRGNGLNTPYEVFNLTDCLCTDSWLTDVSAQTKTFGLVSSLSEPYAPILPITGKGMSRHRDGGLPLFRILQGIEALTQINGLIPTEYLKYGGRINFKGYNYIIDLNEIPIDLIPVSFRIGESYVSVLSLMQQIADITNCNYYVSLLPIIDHPHCAYLYQYNLSKMNSVEALAYKDIVVGIIKVHFVRKNANYTTSAIKTTVENLETRDVRVVSKNYGVESSESISDKVLMGGKETNIKFFRNDQSEFADAIDQPVSKQLFDFTYHLNKSMMPYYGTLNNGALSIPKGRGFFQQALLDSSSVDAYGIGQYYLTTYAELEAALRGFEEWKDFLKAYNYSDSLNIPYNEETFVGAFTIKSRVGICSPRSLFVNPYTANLPLSVNATIYEKLIIQNEIGCFPNLGDYVYQNRFNLLSARPDPLSRQQLGVCDKFFTEHIYSFSDKFLVLPLASLSPDRNSQAMDKILQVLQLEPDSIQEKQIRNMAREKLKTIYADINLTKEQREDKHSEWKNGVENQYRFLNPDVPYMPDLDMTSENNLRTVYQFIDNIARENRSKICVKLPKSANYRYTYSDPYEFRPNNGATFDMLSTMDKIALQNHPLYFLDYESPQTRGTAMSCFFDVMQNDLVFNYTISSTGWFERFLLDNYVFPTELETILNTHRSPLFKMNLCPKNFKRLLSSDGRFENYCIFNANPEFPLNSFILNGNNPMSKAHTNRLYNFYIDQSLHTGRNRFDRYMQLFGNFLKVSDGTTENGRLFKKVSVSDVIHVVPKFFKGTFDKMSCKLIKYQTFVGAQTFDQIGIDYSNKTLDTETYYFYDDILFNVKKVSADKPNLNTSHCYAIVDIDLNIEENDNYRCPDYYTANPNIVNRIDDNDEVIFMTDTIVLGLFSYKVEKYVQKNFYCATPRSIFGSYRIPNAVPDLVCIAMESNDRRYGPWVSSALEDKLNAFNIPASVEHLVNDSLAPWNYSGYNLMNQAATMQVANFNSRRVFIENGSFTIAGPPMGNSIMQPISVGGPLITNVSTTFGEDNRVQTTYDMNTHVPDLSKLQDVANQRMESMANLARKKFANSVNLLPNQKSNKTTIFGGVLNAKLNNKQGMTKTEQRINDLDKRLFESLELRSKNGIMDSIPSIRKQIKSVGPRSKGKRKD